MDINTYQDFKDFVKLLNEKKVKYCIIGSFALAHHAMPRDTVDIDFLVEPTLENGGKVIEVLMEFADTSELSAEDITKKNKIYRLGSSEPNIIEVFTGIPGVDFKEVWEHRERGSLYGEKVYYIGINEFIKSKKATHRYKDKADLEVLLEARNKKKDSK